MLAAAHGSSRYRLRGRKLATSDHRLRPDHRDARRLVTSPSLDIGRRSRSFRRAHQERLLAASGATETTLYAARDRHGVRPLVLGKIGAPTSESERSDGWVVASETAALDIVGAQFSSP